MCQAVQIPTCTRHAIYAFDACFNSSDFFSRVRGQRLVILEAICQILSWKFPALLGL